MTDAITQTVTATILSLGKRQNGTGYSLTFAASEIGSKSTYPFTVSGQDVEDVDGMNVGDTYTMTIERQGLKKDKSGAFKSGQYLEDYYWSLQMFAYPDVMAEGMAKAKEAREQITGERSSKAEHPTAGQQGGREVDGSNPSAPTTRYEQRDYARERLSIERQKAADIAKDLAIAHWNVLSTEERLAFPLAKGFALFFEAVLAAIQGREIMGAESGNASGDLTLSAARSEIRTEPPSEEQEQSDAIAEPRGAAPVPEINTPGEFYAFVLPLLGVKTKTEALHRLSFADEVSLSAIYKDWQSAAAFAVEVANRNGKELIL